MLEGAKLALQCEEPCCQRSNTPPPPPLSSVSFLQESPHVLQVSPPHKATMKCPRYDTTRVCNMEKSADTVAAVGAKVPHVKASPVKEHVPIKPQFPPAPVTRALFSLNNDTRPVHNKENSSSREHDRTLDEGLEDSGYLSLQNSQIDEHHGDEEDDHSQGRTRPSLPLSTTHQERTISPNSSPAKCNAGHRGSVVAASTPVDRHRRRILSSTPCDGHSDPNLPILKYQRAVCEELAKSYRKNKR